MIALTKTEKLIMAAIGEPITPSELAESLGKKKSAAWMLLNKLVRKGRLKKISYGRYWFVRPELDGVDP